MARLFAVALVAGVFTVFFDVSYQSCVPVLLGRADQLDSRLYSPRRHWLEISATLRTRIAR